MTRPVPEWLPIHGKRIKICYKNVKWLCKICYGKHNKKDCDSEKVTWREFVERFAEENPEIPADFYGKYWEKLAQKKMGNLITNGSLLKPLPADFGVPISKSNYNEILIELMKTGMDYETSVADIKDRIKHYKEACSDYTGNSTNPQNGS